MMNLHYTPSFLSIGDIRYPASMGRGGLIAAADKREGDGCTPIGSWKLRELWYRPDLFPTPPETQLPLRAITRQDGWCDDPAHPLYNRHFRLDATPHPNPLPQGEREQGYSPPLEGGAGGGVLSSAITDPLVRRLTPHPNPLPQGGGNNPNSFETLWRDDGVYDLIVPLGYNDDPVVPGKGSAIFLHCARPGYPPTEGCIALARDDLIDVLKYCSKNTLLTIAP